MKAQIQRLLGAVSVGLTVTALLAGGAQADRPDDRAGRLGVGGASSAFTPPTDVFERAAARAIGDRSIRPDEGSGLRSVGGVASVSVVPDAFERAVLRLETSPRPDDRAGLHGPGSIATQLPAATPVSADGFEWGDAAFGAAAALGFVLLAGAAALTIRQRGRVILP
jgi:hypothetical protein